MDNKACYDKYQFSNDTNKQQSAMAQSSSTLTSLSSRPAVSAAVADDRALLDDLAVPQTKSELMALFKNEALPANNKLQPAELDKVHTQRLALYHRQKARTRLFFTAPTHLRPTYPVRLLKDDFIEYQRFWEVRTLDARGTIDFEQTATMWQQIHVVDDLLAQLLGHMPPQRPVGWQVTSSGKNHLQLPTVGRLKDNAHLADQASLSSYVLGHFGVMSYTFDRAYFIGHVLGYLFCCYYLSHLSIAYGVTPLPATSLKHYDFATLKTDKLVRLLQTVTVHCKRRIYQLAVFCARVSCYKLDKLTEKLLIDEVNEFNKKRQIEHLDTLLDTGLMPDVLFDESNPQDDA